MKPETRSQVIAGVVATLASAAVLSLAGVVTRQPSLEIEVTQLHKDIDQANVRLDKMDAKLDRLLEQQRK